MSAPGIPCLPAWREPKTCSKDTPQCLDLKCVATCLRMVQSTGEKPRFALGDFQNTVLSCQDNCAVRLVNKGLFIL